MSEKKLVVSFDANKEPKFEFTGAWSIQDIGHTRSNLLRAYKHYLKEVRLLRKKEDNNERLS